MDKETQAVTKEVIPNPISIMVSNQSSWSRSSSSPSSNDSAVFCCDLPVKDSSSVLGKHLLHDMSSNSLQKRRRNYSSSSASSSLSCISDKESNKSNSKCHLISQNSITSADIASVETTSIITSSPGRPIKEEIQDTALCEPEVTFPRPQTEHPYKTRRTLRKNIQKKACSCDCTSTCTTLTVQHYKKKGKMVKKETVISKTKVKTFANNSLLLPQSDSMLKASSPAKKNNKRRKSEVEQLYDSIHELEWGKDISPDNILQQVNIRQAASASVFGNSKKSNDNFSLHNACHPIKTEPLDDRMLDYSPGKDKRKNILIKIQKRSNKCEIPRAVVRPNQTCTKVPTIQVTLELKKEENNPIIQQSNSIFSSAISQDVKSKSLLSAQEPRVKHESQIDNHSISFVNSFFDVEDKGLNNASFNDVGAEIKIASCFENDCSLPQLTSMAESFFQKTSPSYDGPPVLEPYDFQSCSPNKLSSVTRSVSFIKSTQSVTQTTERGENVWVKSPVKNELEKYIPNLSKTKHETPEKQVNYLIIAAGRRILTKYLRIVRSISKIKETVIKNTQSTSASNTSKENLDCKSSIHLHSPKSMRSKLSDEFLQTEREGITLSPSSIQITANQKVSRIYRCDAIVTPKKCANVMESPYLLSSQLFLDRKPSEFQNNTLDTSINSDYFITKDNIFSLKNTEHPCDQPCLGSSSSESFKNKSLDFEAQNLSNEESFVKTNLIESYSNGSINSLDKTCHIPKLSEVLKNERLDLSKDKKSCILLPDKKIRDIVFLNEESSTSSEHAKKSTLLNNGAMISDALTSCSKISSEIQILPPPVQDPPKPLAYSAITVLFGASYVQVTFKSKRLSLEALKELKDVLQRCSKDPTIKSLVLNGTGDCFSLGLDLFPLLGPEKIKLAFDLAVVVKEFIWELSRFPKPVVAFVTGPAHGLGLTLLTYSDLSIASEDATFCMTHAKFGCVPEGGAVVTLPAAIGAVAACGLLSTGRCLTAQEAKRIRLVEEVLPYEDMPNYLVSRLKMMHKQTISCVETTKTLARMNLNCQLVATLENETKFLPNMWLSPVCQEAIQNSLHEVLPSDSH